MASTGFMSTWVGGLCIDDVGQEVSMNDLVTTHEPEHDDRLLNDRQAAALLGCSPRSVRRWRAQGLLPCVPAVNGVWRYRSGSLRALIRESEGWLG